MRTEILNKDPARADTIDEAYDILNRVDFHQGIFVYMSKREDCLLQLVVRPIRTDQEQFGQPSAHQYAELHRCNSSGLRDSKIGPLARFHYT